MGGQGGGSRTSLFPYHALMVPTPFHSGSHLCVHNVAKNFSPCSPPLDILPPVDFPFPLLLGSRPLVPPPPPPQHCTYMQHCLHYCTCMQQSCSVSIPITTLLIYFGKVLRDIACTNSGVDTLCNFEVVCNVACDVAYKAALVVSALSSLCSFFLCAMSFQIL